MGLGLHEQKRGWRGLTTPWQICQPLCSRRGPERFLFFFKRDVRRAKHWRLNHGVYEESWIEVSYETLSDNAID